VSDVTLEVSQDQVQPHPLWPADKFCISVNGQYLSVADDLTAYTHQDALDKEAFIKPKVQPSTAYLTLLAIRRDGVRHVIVWPK